jgi:hypothetical protein
MLAAPSMRPPLEGIDVMIAQTETNSTTPSDSADAGGVRELDPRQLNLVRRALETDGRLDQVARELGWGGEAALLEALAHAVGMSTVDVTKFEIDLTLLETFPLKLIHRHGLFPLGGRANAAGGNCGSV